MGRKGRVLKKLNFQERTALLFTGVMMIPNLLLACTEEYSAAAIAASLLLPAPFYLVWVTLAPKRPGGMIWWALPLMALEAFQIVLLYLYGGSIIAVDMLTNLFTTSASEAGELMRSLWPSVVFVCAVYIPLLICATISLRRKNITYRPLFRRRAWGVAGAMLVLGIVCSLLATRRPDYGIRYQVFPANIFYNIKLTIDKWHRSQHYKETSEAFTFQVSKPVQAPRREVYVLVIGEASRADNWSLFGYGRSTTPRLEQRDGVVGYPNLLTQCNATHKSVPIILSSVSAEDFNDIYSRKSLIEAFKEAGFSTLFISNQVPNRSLIDYFSEEADQRIDITARVNTLITENHPDGDMVPYLRERLADTTGGNLLVVMHTYGSHYNYQFRYPREWAHFTPDDYPSVNRRSREAIINAYDNTVLYTDYVLDEVISALDESGDCAALFYVSDHGEDIMDDRRRRFLHASPTPTYYQLHVAAFGWFSQQYQTLYPEKYAAARANAQRPATTAATFHTITDMASLESPYSHPEQSLVSAAYFQGPRYYLNDHDKAVRVLESGLKREDFQMLRQHKMIDGD